MAVLQWQSAVAEALGTPLAWSPIHRGSFNPAWRAEGRGRIAFVKVAAAEAHAMLAAEAAGLRLLRASGPVGVPGVLACGTAPDGAYLALEWLDLADGGRDAALGTGLARLHRHTAPRFGWDRDNTIGTTPQRNRWHDAWAAFWIEERLRPQLALALARTARVPWAPSMGERLLAAVPALLAGHRPAPSLVHGDLWSGNAGGLATGAPVIFDPAPYYGDRETDLAMTELFGGFGPDFYAAYDREWPRAAGYARRRPLYNLYHVLNHFNLFGGDYGPRAAAMMAELVPG